MHSPPSLCMSAQHKHASQRLIFARAQLSRIDLRAAAFCERLLDSAGTRLAGPIAILRNWTFCLFYVMAELWGSVVVSLLFWGFANQVRQLSPYWLSTALL